MSKQERTLWVTCASCGHRSTRHRVLHEKDKTMFDEDVGEPYREYHRLVECMGCETIKYVTSTVIFPIQIPKNLA